MHFPNGKCIFSACFMVHFFCGSGAGKTHAFSWQPQIWRNMHFPRENACVLHVSAASKMHVAACCCMLLHVSSIFSNLQGYIKKTCIFPGKNIISGGIEPSINACCRMHVARGPLRTLWLFPSPPWVPLLLSPVWFQWNCQRIGICMSSSLAKEL